MVQDDRRTRSFVRSWQGAGRLLRPATAALLLSCAPLAAADAPELPADATPMEKAAHGVLKEHCAACHQDGALKEGLNGPKGGIDNILDLSAILANAKLIDTAEPEKSKLLTVLDPFAFPRMPDNCTIGDTACGPKPEEIKALTDWLTAATTKKAEEAAARETVSLAREHEVAAADIREVPTNRQADVRYISFRVQSNHAALSNEEVDAHRRATIKALNALSTEPELVRDDTEDGREVVLRIRLSDLGWDAEKWEMLARAYPYGVRDDADGALNELKRLTYTEVPIIRSDWLVAHATMPPLYHDLLGLSETFEGLQRSLGIDLNANLRKGRAVRAGFQDSGVSDHNRLIERHEMTGGGFFWTSYDFAGSKGRQNLHEFPLGPKEAFDSELTFEHDGGESIFTLPNGFHAYYLNTEKGERLDVGPTKIVRDTDYPDGTGEVVNGISCMSCHIDGMRFRNDTVRIAADGNLSIHSGDMQVIREIYPGADRVNEVLERDKEAFLKRLDDAGVGRTTRVAGKEPIRGLFIYHHDAPIDAARAAAELGLTVDDMKSRAPFLGPELAGVFRRLEQAPLARDEWQSVFPAMLERLTRYKAVRYERQATDARPQPASVAKAVRYSEPPKKVVSTGLRRGGLTMYTDRSAYRKGEQGVLTIEPRDDCRLTLLNINPKGQACLLYPNAAFGDGLLKAGRTFTFPPRGTMTFDKTGTETFVALCDASRGALAKLKDDRPSFTCVAGGTAGQRLDGYVEGQTKLEVHVDPNATPDGTSAPAGHRKDLRHETLKVTVKP